MDRSAYGRCPKERGLIDVSGCFSTLRLDGGERLAIQHAGRRGLGRTAGTKKNKGEVCKRAMKVEGTGRWGRFSKGF